MRRILVLAFLIGGSWLLMLVTIVQDARKIDPQVWMFFNDDGKFYRMRPDGADRMLLLNGRVGRLTWSPDNRTFVASVQYHPTVPNRHLYHFDRLGQTSRPIDEQTYRSFLVRWSPRNEGFIYMAISKDEIRNIHTPSKLFFVERQTLDVPDVRDITPIQSDLEFGGWTPDGEWIILSGSYAGSEGVFRVRPDGSGFEALGVNTSNNQVISLSVDGEWVVYLAQNIRNEQQLYRIRTDGGQPQHLTTGGGHIDTAQLSPDGEWIIYQYSDGTQTTLFLMRLDGTDEVVVAEDAVTVLDFSPNSEWVYFLVRNGNTADLYGANMENPQELVLIDTSVARYISWSPSQEWFAYAHRSAAINTYDMQNNTSHLIGIQSIRQFFYGQIWSSDSQWVYFVQRNGDDHVLYRQRSDGSEQIRITEVSTDVEIVGWSPIIDFAWNAEMLSIIGLGAIGGSLCVGYWFWRS